MSMMVKEQIIYGIDRLMAGITRPRGMTMTNLAQIHTAYVYQTLAKIAADRCKDAWAELARTEVIPSDEKIRKKGEGVHPLYENKDYEVCAKVVPRTKFDREKCIKALCKKWKLPKAMVEAVFDASYSEGTPQLIKRVKEVE